MKEHSRKLLKAIKDSCDSFLDKKISLTELQQNIEAIRSNFENDADKTLQNAVYNFVEQLEYIRFMFNENEKFNEATEEIKKLNLVIT